MRLSFSILGLSVLTLLMTSAICFADAPLYTSGNVLAAGNYNDGFSSSDITLIIQLEVGGEIIFDEGAEVKYLVPDSDVDGWTEPGFDDSGWEDGITSVGYADGDDNTVIPSGQVGSVYTRYHFDVPDASSVSEITFRVDFDDAYILWLNGVEIARSSNIEVLSPVGDIPAWDVSRVVDSIQDIEATTVAAGTPNSARWGRGSIGVHVVDVSFGGTTSVEPQGKLSVLWGGLKQD